MSTLLNPKRTVAELKELRALTGDENGAQRVAFTKTWLKAREFLRSKVAGLPLEIHNDAAGHTCIAVSGPMEMALTVETGESDRAENMVAFAAAALELLKRAVEA